MIEIIKHDGLFIGQGFMPINDEHEFTKCSCKPYKYEGVHNSFDGREHNLHWSCND